MRKVRKGKVGRVGKVRKGGRKNGGLEVEAVEAAEDGAHTGHEVGVGEDVVVVGGGGALLADALDLAVGEEESDLPVDLFVDSEIQKNRRWTWSGAVQIRRTPKATVWPAGLG